MKSGKYRVRLDWKLCLAEFDGLKWKHEDYYYADLTVVPLTTWEKVKKLFGVRPVLFGCPTGCTCTVNSDGSVTTHCT